MPTDVAHEVTGYSTLQFGWGGLFDFEGVGAHIHLVRSCGRFGTPGPTLCGIDRFAKECPGWSVGGGVTPTGQTGCPKCEAATDPALPIGGTHKDKFRGAGADTRKETTP